MAYINDHIVIADHKLTAYVADDVDTARRIDHRVLPPFSGIR
jgi:hypothetical protein